MVGVRGEEDDLDVGCSAAQPWTASGPSMSGSRRSSRTTSGRSALDRVDRLAAGARVAGDVSQDVLLQRRGSRRRARSGGRRRRAPGPRQLGHRGTHACTVTPPSSLRPMVRCRRRRARRSDRRPPGPDRRARMPRRSKPDAVVGDGDRDAVALAKTLTTTDWAWACFSTLSSASRAASASAAIAGLRQRSAGRRA